MIKADFTASIGSGESSGSNEVDRCLQMKKGRLYNFFFDRSVIP